jgi:hypothetical protein
MKDCRNYRRRDRGHRFFDLREVEFDFVDVAPTPIFAGLDGSHDWVFGCVEMFCGVFVFRGIAASDVATDHAHP